MSKYNFKEAKRLIQLNSDLLVDASLGIKEDWFWTAETVYEEGNFTVNLDTVKKIGGIEGSSWATPSILLVFKNGTEKLISCCIGEQDISKKPIHFESGLGVLSTPCQEYINTVNTPKLTSK